MGNLTRGAKGFTLSLGADASNLLICFKPDLTNGVILCKYKTGGKDGPEMSYPSSSFKPEAPAKMSFSFIGTEVDTQVTVTLPDNTQFQFNSQVNLDYIAYILVEGDFVVQSVTMA
ncbi:galectin-1-like [Eublepharis macularius]|uniref:Galectin n=1 Tax=Eublepharis macularius TaxID=481883 RepID=A0AA97J4T3_EUBMA|nr:galectin-1-like [Eublepharis macularius]